MVYRVLLFVILAGSNLFAQTAKDVFDTSKRITWVGVDFSKARIVGDPENLVTADEIQNFMDAINRLMADEAGKYDIAGALDRYSVENALHITMNKNKALDGKSLRIWEKVVPEPLKRSQIQEIVTSYDFEGREGIAVMINVDQFNKYNIKGSLWITFIDMKSKSVLFTDRLTAEAGGSGIRNFWAGTIYRAIKAMKRGMYDYWRKKYGKE